MTTVSVGAQPLQVTKSLAPDTIDAGGTVTYTIRVNNPGGEYSTDAFSIRVSGGVSGSYSGGVNSGGLRIVRDNSGIKSVKGTVTIPSLKISSSGEAMVRIGINSAASIDVPIVTTTRSSGIVSNITIRPGIVGHQD